jgi:nitrogen fixation/metabolism regulation signal transduction histidine kinase
VNLLANPVVLRMAIMLVVAAAAFLLGVTLLRQMRRSLHADATFTADAPSAQTLPLDTYSAVIQQLKQQKHELQSEQQADRRRAKASENISATVLANLPTGVLFFSPDGLVRQANGAAKRILGFASPIGMRVSQIFREGMIIAHGAEEAVTIAAAIESALHEKPHFQKLSANYGTPSGEERTLELTLSSVQGPGGEFLGATCALNDQSELMQYRRQQEWLEQISGEMALDLHNSLNAISGYAQQLAATRETEAAQRLAGDIAVEAAHLDHTVGGFLAGGTAYSSEIKVVMPLDLRAAPARRFEQPKTEQI